MKIKRHISGVELSIPHRAGPFMSSVMRVIRFSARCLGVLHRACNAPNAAGQLSPVKLILRCQH